LRHARSGRGHGARRSHRGDEPRRRGAGGAAAGDLLHACQSLRGRVRGYDESAARRGARRLPGGRGRPRPVAPRRRRRGRGAVPPRASHRGRDRRTHGPSADRILPRRPDAPGRRRHQRHAADRRDERTDGVQAGAGGTRGHRFRRAPETGALMLIAQISDTHIKPEGRLGYRRVDTALHLARCVEHVQRLTPVPDVVLVTGDLVDAGLDEEYTRLRRLLAPLPMPVYVIPGNHDARDPLRRAFGCDGYLPREGEYLHYVIDTHPLRLIGLDTLVPGESGGRLGPDRLAWLDARLAEAPQRPTLVFMHHPPFKTGIEGMDSQWLEDSEALRAVI